MELRFHFAKELSNELELDKYLVVLENKFITKFGIKKNDPDLNFESDIWKPVVKELISKNLTTDDKFEYLADNIDKILIELAEIFPILAYELSGQHNIKERINNFDNLINGVQLMTDEIPFDIKQWINPKLTKDLLANLDHSIKKIAKKIGTGTWQMARNKIKTMIFEGDVQEFDTWIDEYLDKIIENMPKE